MEARHFCCCLGLGKWVKKANSEVAMRQKKSGLTPMNPFILIGMYFKVKKGKTRTDLNNGSNMHENGTF